MSIPYDHHEEPIVGQALLHIPEGTIDSKQIAAIYVLGDYTPSDLVQIAVEALSAGSDTPSLRILAEESVPHWSETIPRFERALAELGISLPPRQEALLYRAKPIAEAVVAGRTPPMTGAYAIWMFCVEEREPHPYFRRFLELASLYDDNTRDPDKRAFCAEVAKLIVETAKELLTYLHA